MADACWLACDDCYDVSTGKWDSEKSEPKINERIPALFISVELDKEELQTMALAFISGVPENHILEPDLMDFEEGDRLRKAANILKRSALHIEYLPDYSIRDIENCIKRNLRVHKTQAVFMDYITTSMSMLEEIAHKTGVKMREDQILFQFSSKLKDLAGQYQIFIFSSTQLNGSFKTEKIPDQTLLSGAKAIANRIDFGCILLDTTEEDIEDLNKAGNFIERYQVEPNVKCSVYKNRRGQWNRILLWMRADKGTCRYDTVFITDYMLRDITHEFGIKKGE